MKILLTDTSIAVKTRFNKFFLELPNNKVRFTKNVNYFNFLIKQWNY